MLSLSVRSRKHSAADLAVNSLGSSAYEVDHHVHAGMTTLLLLGADMKSVHISDAFKQVTEASWHGTLWPHAASM